MRTYSCYANNCRTSVNEVTDFKTGKRRIDVIVYDEHGKEMIHRVGLLGKSATKRSNPDFLTRQEACSYALVVDIII